MDVVILGRIGYDLFAEDHNVSLKEVRRFSRYVGGSSANIAVGLSRLGLRVGMISCVGTDPLSDYVVEYLEHEEVATRFVQRKAGYVCSLSLTEVSPPNHFPQVFYRDRPADTQVEVGGPEQEFIESARMFVTNGTSLCASPSRESTYRALESAQRAGAQVAFDVDFRASSWSGPKEAGLYARLALPFIHTLIANPEEICMVAQETDAGRAVTGLRNQGVPLVVAKMGSEGTRATSLVESVFLPSFPVQVVSTIGAGDGFASGFLYAIFRGFPLSEALRYGNAAAAIVVSRLMCSEAMPTLAEVEALIAQQQNRIKT